MAKLRAVTDYRNPPRGLEYQAGAEFDADDGLTRFLLSDAPDAFEHVKAPAAPPANKAIMHAPERKTARDDLTQISGISSAKARQLAVVGIASFADLAVADVAVLARIRGVGDVTAQAWIEDAKERV